MNDKLKIKLSIADRIYPLTIQPSQEEGLRRSAKEIEKVIKQFEQSYAVRDKQDVLAMCALQFAAKTEQQVLQNQDQVLQAQDKLSLLNELLEQHLNE